MYSARTATVSLDSSTQQYVDTADQSTQASGAVGGDKSDCMYTKHMPPPEYPMGCEDPYPYDEPPSYYAELPPLPQYEPAPGGENPYDVPRNLNTYDCPRSLRSDSHGATGGTESLYESPQPRKFIPSPEVSRPEKGRGVQVLPSLPSGKNADY